MDRYRIAIATMAVVLATASAGCSRSSADVPDATGSAVVGESSIGTGFAKLTSKTTWQEINRVKLNFPTFHTEGIAFTPDRIFLSAVEIIEPTVKYPAPQDGYDRSAGKGVGHLFVMDRTGNLQTDIILGDGDIYHPGGIDFDGTNVWVPVAQYRPNSSAIIYRVDATTLSVHRQFDAKDHFGGIVMDKKTGHLVGNTWGSRRFAEWDMEGNELSSWDNPSHFIDYQDCQYIPQDQMLCGGIANLQQTPTAGGANGTYELGGIALIDAGTHAVIHEIPIQLWSTAAHIATRNPFKMKSEGNYLTMSVAPDNGEEGNGTEIITYQTPIPR